MPGIEDDPRFPRGSIGPDEREEFIRLMEALGDDGRARVLALARHYVRQRGMSWADVAPAIKSQRKRHGRGGCSRRRT
jgi:hypothetical protein